MTATITVTTAELHARLDELLAAVRSGTIVRICDPGQPDLVMVRFDAPAQAS